MTLEDREENDFEREQALINAIPSITAKALCMGLVIYYLVIFSVFIFQPIRISIL